MKKILVVVGSLFVLLVLAYLFQQNGLKEGAWGADGRWYDTDDEDSSEDEGMEEGSNRPHLPDTRGELGREFAWNDPTGHLPSGNQGIDIGPGNSQPGEYMPGEGGVGSVSAEGPPYTITDRTGRYITDRDPNPDTGRYRVLTQQQDAHPNPEMPTGTEYDPGTGTTVMTHDQYGNPVGDSGNAAGALDDMM